MPVTVEAVSISIRLLNGFETLFNEAQNAQEGKKSISAVP